MRIHQLPGVAALRDQFATARYSIFRLETLQNYAGSGEDAGIAAFQRGDSSPPVDPAEEEYAARIRAHRAAGRTWQRVHVITEPISDYLAYELTWEYGPHVFAGEDIRIIDATDRWPQDVPPGDFWLFDSAILFNLAYDEHGMWLGAERIHDHQKVAEACFIREAAWHQAVQWSEYMTRHTDLMRRVPEAG